MRGAFAAVARRLGLWCLHRVWKPVPSRAVAPDPGVCKVVKLSALKDRWQTVVVPDVGAILAPGGKPRRRGRKVLRSRGGIGARALVHASLPVGPVHTTDFSLPYALVQEETGVKRLYRAADDLTPFLALTTSTANGE